METNLYSIIKDKDTNEFHIFKIDKDNMGHSKAQDKSICQEMNYHNQTEVYHDCLDEDTIRKKAVDIGRQMCGICISSLYATFKH